MPIMNEPKQLMAQTQRDPNMIQPAMAQKVNIWIQTHLASPSGFIFTCPILLVALSLQLDSLFSVLFFIFIFCKIQSQSHKFNLTTMEFKQSFSHKLILQQRKNKFKRQINLNRHVKGYYTGLL